MIVVFTWCPITEPAFRLWFILRRGWTRRAYCTLIPFRHLFIDDNMIKVCLYSGVCPFPIEGIREGFFFTTFRHHAFPSLFPGFLSAFSPFYQSGSRQNDLRGSYLASLARQGRSWPLGQALPWPFFLSFSLFLFLYKLIITTKAASFILDICRKIK